MAEETTAEVDGLPRFEGEVARAVPVHADNPFGKLLSGIVFKVAPRGKEWEKGSGMERKMANAAILLTGGVAALAGSVYVTRQANGKKVIGMRFLGNMTTRTSSFLALGAENRAHLDEWRASAANVAKTWIKANAAELKASATTDVEADDIDI